MQKHRMLTILVQIINLWTKLTLTKKYFVYKVWVLPKSLNKIRTLFF